MDIGGWLRSLGLDRYEAAFRENEIDDTVLPTVTAEDLKEVGVDVVGHRRKLLNAIALLRADANAKAPLAEEAPSTLPNSPQDTAERRQVTVMFSDLVGSTALAGRMDPEDLREVISAYQKCVAETVRRFGGFVAKYMGDGVLVYFGYPQAHEDEAERAVRAGLELIQTVSGLKSSAPLQTRIGIATGLVVVGDLIGSGDAQERGIVGETPNLAARLQGIAEPNTVVIAESTRKLARQSLRVCKTSAHKNLKGIGAPVKAWAVLRPSSVASRFEALHATGLTALVGREEELELLLRRWSRAKTGEGQVALLSGEAGIGKSRLTAALLERLTGEPHTRLRYFCSPQHTDSALYPVISQMERAAGFVYDDTPQVKLNKLDAVLAQTSTSKQDAALFAEMLSLPNDGRYPALELTPEQRRQRTLETLISQVQKLTHQSPVLMIFEDAHWSDPTSLEVLGRIVDRVRSLPVLLLVTFRPEFDPPWLGRPYVTALTINRLAERDISVMIDRVVGNKLLPANIRQDIIERTDGIPLFVEEMTKAVLEAGSEGAVEHLAAAVPSSALAVPASLQASLMARLDRLGPAKEVTQIGAAIGREFSYALLAAVVRKPETDINSALDRLVAAGLLFRQGVAPRASYLFKHALVQDAAYGTLLREPRRTLHARIAETLENQFAEIAENQPELLARHCTEAGLIDKAAGLWGKAGQRSLERSALVEATEQFSRALAQIATLPGTPALRRERIKLQVAFITPLIHVRGYAAPETKAAVERAHSLIEEAKAIGEPPEDPLLLFSVLFGLCAANIVAFNADVCLDLSSQFLTLAEKQDSKASLLIAHRIVGQSLALSGDIVKARAHYDAGLALYDPVAHGPLATRFSSDSEASFLSMRSWDCWLLGYPDIAARDAERALARAREFGHATLMYTMSPSLLFQICCRDVTAATAIAEEFVTLANEKGAALWSALGVLMQGCILEMTGKASNAVQMFSTALAAYRATGATVFMPFVLSFNARAHADIGQFDDAWRAIGDAMAAVQATKETWFEAELHRITGEIALKSPERDTAKAQAHFERALAVARQQQAKSWELRATMSMARLWCDQGKRKEARNLLAPVYGWFTEGFDTLDLKEAKKLLEELA